MGHIIAATSRLSAYDFANEYADNALTDVSVLIDWVGGEVESDADEVEQLRDDLTPGQWDEVFAAADVARALVDVLGHLTGSPWLGLEVPTDDQLLADGKRVVALRDLLQEIKDAFEHEGRNRDRVLVAEGEWVEYIEQETKELAPEAIRESDWHALNFIDWEELAEAEAYSTITVDGDEYRYKTD
jgi:hypothetical protein